MSIEATSSVTNSSRSHFEQIRSDFRSLRSDLQAGNLAGAQADFATLLQDAPALQNQLKNGTSSPASGALQALSTSLQAGDLHGAQTAFASLPQAWGPAHRHHHHRHHGGGVSPADPQAAKNDFQALAGALRSGDLAGAQKALAHLQQDDPRFAAGSGPTSSSSPVAA